VKKAECCEVVLSKQKPPHIHYSIFNRRNVLILRNYQTDPKLYKNCNFCWERIATTYFSNWLFQTFL